MGWTKRRILSRLPDCVMQSVVRLETKIGNPPRTVKCPDMLVNVGTLGFLSAKGVHAPPLPRVGTEGGSAGATGTVSRLVQGLESI
jgi:hypothetical protein